MAFTLDATVAGADANAYLTRAEADAYFEIRPHSDSWAGYSTTQKESAIIAATRMLDHYIEWKGARATDEQRLAWPRSGLSFDGRDIAEDEIPEQIQWATAELALALRIEDRVADSDVETQGLRSLKAGPIELEFRDGVRAKAVPDAVWYYIAPFGVVLNRKSATVKLVRS